VNTQEAIDDILVKDGPDALIHYIRVANMCRCNVCFCCSVKEFERNTKDMAAYIMDLKIARYKAGKYMFSPPPVPHTEWDTAAWIRFIDKHGKWL